MGGLNFEMKKHRICEVECRTMKDQHRALNLSLGGYSFEVVSALLEVLFLFEPPRRAFASNISSLSNVYHTCAVFGATLMCTSDILLKVTRLAKRKYLWFANAELSPIHFATHGEHRKRS